MATKVNYRNEKVYIGVDVHKRHYSICCVHEGCVVRMGRVPARYELMVKFIEQYFPEAEVFTAYEAGFSGFGLHRFLQSKGIHNIVINAASIEVSSRDRVKTDKRDANKIAIQLAAGRLQGILVPTVEQENKRLLSRTREQLVRHRTRIGLQVKSRLFQFGLISADDRRCISEKFFTYHFSNVLSTELRTALTVLVEQWRFVNQQVKELNKKLTEQAKNDEFEKIYRSVPGIGPIGARILSNELGNLSQFKNERKLFSFIGFSCTEYSSGESRHQGHITRQGSARIRATLVEAAWQAIRKDQSLKETYLRISLRAGGKRAIVAIARKLIGRIRACFRQDKVYQLAAAA